MRRIDLIPLTLNIKFHWLKLNCLRACACEQRKHQRSISFIGYFSCPLHNTTFIINLDQIDCLFNRFFQITKMKFRLWLELAWVPWQKTPDVKMSLDATKLIVEEPVQAITTESTNVLFLWTTVSMLTMATKTLCQWCPLCQCWPLCQWWSLCQCWPWPPNTVPMMSMTTKTLCQWWPLCQCWPWPPKHCANDDHCANVDHDNQNTVPMMTIVPMLTRATKALCQWWPLCQCCPWPPKHCANDVHCANVVHVYQNTAPMMTTVSMLITATITLCQWWPLCQCWPWPPKHCANDVHCANVDHGHQNTVPMMIIVPMLTMATKHCANDVHDNQDTVPMLSMAPYGVINTITCVIYKWNVWVWLTLWEPDHFKGRLDGRGHLLEWGRASLWGAIYGMVSTSQADQMMGSANSSFILG